jgi:hypothetical protein
VLLPSYNALKDPFLIGYFDNPTLKRHLKETGVIKRKRRHSVKSPLPVDHKTEGVRTEIKTTFRKSKKSKSRAKSLHHKEIKLPDIEQERTEMKSAATTRLKKVYGSR